jgi:hypothetical protein
MADVFEWLAGLCECEPQQVELVQSIPGMSTRLTTYAPAVAQASIREAGFTARQESVLVRVGGMDAAEAAVPPRMPTPADSLWVQATRKAESSLDKDLKDNNINVMDEEDQDKTSNVEMFSILVAAGAEAKSAAKCCQRYLSSLRKLKASGLIEGNDGARIVRLLDKYNGGVTRVADALFKSATPGMDQQREEGGSSSGSEDDKDWSQEISSLGEMGLDVSNRVLLVSLLEQSQGNLQRVIEQLLGEA